MAEVAAIALVGNILQFVEVGIKLTRTAQKAYNSTSGLIQEYRTTADAGRSDRSEPTKF
jgi:hypothetical protein